MKQKTKPKQQQNQNIPQLRDRRRSQQVPRVYTSDRSGGIQKAGGSDRRQSGSQVRVGFVRQVWVYRGALTLSATET